jgi:hypothetical protein
MTTTVTKVLQRGMDGHQSFVASMIQSSDGTSMLPIFVGNVDPATDEILLPLVAVGAMWIDTSYGPPFQQNQWQVIVGTPMWVPAPMIVYDEVGNVAGRITMFANAGDALGDGGSVEVSAFFGADGVNGTLRIDSNGIEFNSDSLPLNIHTPSVMCTLLPTSDPGFLNQLWNDNGTLKVSAGA